MKFIFSFLLIFTFLSPVYADYAPGTPSATCNQYDDPTDQNDRLNCIATPGCGWDSDYACSQCDTGSASAANATSCTSCSGNANYQTIISDPTKQHPVGATTCSDWVCATDYTLIGSSCLQCSTTIPQNSHYVTDCNHWACDAGYYRYTNDDNEDVCGQCPQNSTSASGSTSINQCSCEAGYVKLLDRNNNWISSLGCVTAPANPWIQVSNDSTKYKCATHATLTINGNSVTCDCPTGSTFNSNDCACTGNYHFVGTTDNYTCAGCPSNSSWDAQTQQCYCNDPTSTDLAGYFWNNAKTECIKCPTPSDTAPYEGDSNYISDCAGYYSCDIDDAHLNLIKVGNKYYCGTCGFGMNTELENTTIECNCASVGANNTNSPTPSGQQCACPNGASNSNNKCVCNTSPATILKTSSNNTFSCVSCSNIVANSIFQANIQSGSTSIVYTDGFSLNSNNNACNACICDTGYYKNGNRNECTNCPIGLTTTDSGATSRDDCKMTKTVKLCLVTNNTNRTTSNATQCMQPIPQSADMTDVWPNN